MTWFIILSWRTLLSTSQFLFSWQIANVDNFCFVPSPGEQIETISGILSWWQLIKEQSLVYTTTRSTKWRCSIKSIEKYIEPLPMHVPESVVELPDPLFDKFVIIWEESKKTKTALEMERIEKLILLLDYDKLSNTWKKVYDYLK